MKKVFLLNPKIQNRFTGAAQRPPVGLGYLSQYLISKNIEHVVFDMELGYSQNFIINEIKKYSPDFIGISFLTLGYKFTYKFIEKIKKNTNAKIVVGGPHVSTFREKVLEECKSVDYAIVLEGEYSFHELISGKNNKDIKGLIYRNENDNVIFNGEREFIKDLDSIAFPKYEKFELDNYITNNISILTSRGCPYACTYCPVKTTIGKKYRMRSAENVCNEIEYWHNEGNSINIVDDNFSMSIKRVEEICDIIENKDLKGLKIKFNNGLRADRVDYNLLKRIRNIGGYWVAFGVEAGNNKILKEIKKGETIEVIDKAIKNACDLGYDVTLFFMVGHPKETINDVLDSAKLAKKYPVYDVQFYNIIPFPKTELYDYVEKNCLFRIQPEQYLNYGSHFENQPLFETPELSIEQRKKVMIYLQKIRKKVKLKAAKRKLSFLGPFSLLAAYIYSFRKIQVLILQNKLVRKIAEYFYNKSQ